MNKIHKRGYKTTRQGENSCFNVPGSWVLLYLSPNISKVLVWFGFVTVPFQEDSMYPTCEGQPLLCIMIGKETNLCNSVVIARWEGTEGKGWEKKQTEPWKRGYLTEGRKMFSDYRKMIPQFRNRTLFYYIKSCCFFFFPCYLEVVGVTSELGYSKEKHTVFLEAFS